MTPPTDRLRHDALAIYQAAIEGVEPRRALTRALAATPPPNRVCLFAMGKAAFPMAAAAVQHLDRLEIPVEGGVVVTPDAGESPDRRLVRVQGDHPAPGPRSRAAADALGAAVSQCSPRDEAWVLLSGGTSSLIGAPIDRLSEVEYRLLVASLARAGLPIHELNLIRKRFSRWGAGRLTTALRAARIRVFALSDVPGDHPADIGSGPCEADASTAEEVLTLVRRLGAGIELPPAVPHLLERIIRGEAPETPKPGDDDFERVSTRIVASNTLAVDLAAERAAALGYRVVRAREPVEGEAAAAGRDLARRVLDSGPAPGTAWVQGGETTVALGPEHGRGGRCQEFALAAAEAIAAAPLPIAVLAGGTDGRDGPTDAGGAVVTNHTWSAIRDTGIDPAAALAGHDAHPALDAAGALIRPGLTGTNVMDVMLALTGGPAGPETDR